MHVKAKKKKKKKKLIKNIKKQRIRRNKPALRKKNEHLLKTQWRQVNVPFILVGESKQIVPSPLRPVASVEGKVRQHVGGLILANFNHLQDKKKIKTDCQQKSAPRMTASVPKQDPNTHKVQKNAYLLGQKHYLQMFGVIPLVKLQKDT